MTLKQRLSSILENSLLFQDVIVVIIKFEFIFEKMFFIFWHGEFCDRLNLMEIK